MEGVYLRLILLLTTCFAIIGSLKASILDWDSHWQERHLMAKKAAQAAYNPNPYEVTQHLNHKVHLAMEGRNVTRRSLKQAGGACEAINPIDKCWRCDKNWADNRKKIVGCALGFGSKATGGKAGEFYEVTDPSDDDVINPKPGTLRWGALQKKPLWITFAKDMNIKLKQEMMVCSDKTIDGRGAEVHISNGGQITLQLVKNIIITNIHVHDNVVTSGGPIMDQDGHAGARGKADGDGISLWSASDVWIDHVTLSKCADGLIDVVEKSTAVTISNCHLTNHNDVMLFGASDSTPEDKILQVTVAFNVFGAGLVQRLPRVRFGFAHVVNNEYVKWIMYALGGSSGPTILSQGNRFTAPDNANAKEITKRDTAPESVWKNWDWQSEGDVLLNGATFTPSGKKISGPGGLIPAKPGTAVPELTRSAGALKCVVGSPC